MKIDFSLLSLANKLFGQTGRKVQSENWHWHKKVLDLVGAKEHSKIWFIGRSLARFNFETAYDICDVLLQMHLKGNVTHYDILHLLIVPVKDKEVKSYTDFINHLIEECSPDGRYYVEEFYTDYQKQILPI